MSIASQTTQAAFLSATSNLIAQGVSAYQEHRAFSLDLVALLKYVAFGILNTPPNALWQQYLEDKFPSSSEEPEPKKKSGKKSEKKSQPANNGTRNLAIKFALDQSVGAVMNILLFLVATNALNGASTDEIITAVKRDSLEVYTSGLVIWPLVSFICFVAVPVEKRVVVGSVAGVLWGVYLSLVASR